MSDRPALSVVIAASDSSLAVKRTLASLRDQLNFARVEIIVAAAGDRIKPTEPSMEGVRWVAAEPGSGVPRLRRLGFEQARGELVVFTEDSCVFEPGWVAGWISAFANLEVSAATGPVEPGMGHRPLDWAVFFCEYAPFAAPRHGQGAAPSRLAGNNFGVRANSGLATLEGLEIHESDVARECLRLGMKLVETPDSKAHHVRRYGWREAFGDRLRFGFEFGRLRAQRHPWWLNTIAWLAAPAIFAVQAARLTLVVAARGRFRLPFLASLPITLGLLTAWSVGEALGWTSGCWRGPGAGASAADRPSADIECGTGGRTPGRASPPPGR